MKDFCCLRCSLGFLPLLTAHNLQCTIITLIHFVINLLKCSCWCILFLLPHFYAEILLLDDESQFPRVSNWPWSLTVHNTTIKPVMTIHTQTFLIQLFIRFHKKHSSDDPQTQHCANVCTHATDTEWSISVYTTVYFYRWKNNIGKSVTNYRFHFENTLQSY